MSLPQLLIIVGPTASGKSALAVRIAKANNAVVLSADSRQFYKEVSIGTARITQAEMDGVPHLLVGESSVYHPISAGQFEHLGLKLIEEQHLLGRNVVVCGGSGLFLDALVYGMDDLPGSNPEVRQSLENLLQAEGLGALVTQLYQLDPVILESIDVHNPRRVIRALEVCLVTGKPYSSLRTKKEATRPFEAVWIAPDWPRELLYERINWRVEQMVANGLEEEARNWQHAFQLEAFNTIGYQEWLPYFHGEASRDSVIEAIQRNTRRLAKRQLTYWRRNPNIVWIKHLELENFSFTF